MIQANAGNAFDSLKKFSDENTGEWLFGHFGYDLKNEIEELASTNFDGIQFPDLYFFVPEVVLKLSKTTLTVYSDTKAAEIYNAVMAQNQVNILEGSKSTCIESRISKELYIDTVKKLQAHMLRGDCYEINYCQEFFGSGVYVDPLSVYKKLCTISPNPFAALYKLDDKYCICASPERFLKKSGSKAFSQPIKGTAKRNLQDQYADEQNLLYLLKVIKKKVKM